MSSFAKLLWIELIGFDNTAVDFGVAELLGRMPIKPEAVSLLLWNTEVIHAHQGLQTDGPLGPQQCSYCGRSFNEERSRQDWTRFQLRDLIAELHRHGVKVYPSVFDQVLSDATAARFGYQRGTFWLDAHPEVLYVLDNGQLASSICPWKRLADGTLYEDFFFAQLEKFLVDYDFDGLHAADGFAHPRFPINRGDFSNDMVEQFAEATGVAVHPGDRATQAAWILRHAYPAWVDFHTRRHQQFWRKGMAMLERLGKDHVFNSIWTRDPFEARFRYGVDYRLLAEAGVQTFIVEATAAVLELEGWIKSPTSGDDQFMAAIARLKADVPECRLILLNGVKDGLEQYSALRHAPTRLESDVQAFVNVFYQRQRCLDGVMTCLSDGIRPGEWEAIDSIYQTAFYGEPASFPQVTLLWSHEAMLREEAAYFQKRPMSSFRLHCRLHAYNAICPVMADLADLPRLTGPVAVIHPVYLSEKEQETLAHYTAGSVLLLGLQSDNRFGYRIHAQSQVVSEGYAELAPRPEREVYSWLDELPEAMPEEAFLRQMAAAVRQCGSPATLSTEDSAVKAWGFRSAAGCLHLFARNERGRYLTPEFRCRGQFQAAQALTDYPSLPVQLWHEDGNTVFSAKIPPHGTIVLELKQ